MQPRPTKFWLVWCPTSDKSPREKHETQPLAQREAERLAAKYPGQMFYVVEALSYSLKADMHTVGLVEEAGDIPF